MLNTGGIDATIGSGRGGLWYDDEVNNKPPTKKSAVGFRVGLRWGPMWVRFPGTWRECLNAESGKQGPIVTLPFIVLPFISIVVGKFVAYFGGKYNGWGIDNYIIPSVTIRWSDDR
jgi:hypothetical protein